LFSSIVIGGGSDQVFVLPPVWPFWALLVVVGCDCGVSSPPAGCPPPGGVGCDALVAPGVGAKPSTLVSIASWSGSPSSPQAINTSAAAHATATNKSFI
jgi:hypothetical protein